MYARGMRRINMELSILEERIKEIMDICTYIHKSEGKASEKIAYILLDCYDQGKQDGLKVALECLL